MTDLGDPPGGPDYSAASDVNDSGQVVGYSRTASGNRGFLWQDGVGMMDLNDLLVEPSGWTLEHASAINDAGQIVGYGIHNGLMRGFLLTPVNAADPVP